MHQIPNSVASRALILAPLGRDAAVAGMLLRDAAIRFATCTNVGDLLASLSEETCFAVIAEEALRSCDLSPLSTWLDGQPTWSDMPFIILTRHGSAFHPDIQRISKLLGNVTLLERPFHPLTFMSVAKTAYKGRFRQYEARARIEELRESEERLEQRVAERTEQLKQAHAAILAEMTQRQNAEEKLRQSQKLEMIGQLTGGVAHDFNNLLMAVISNLDLLRRRVSTDSTALRLIDGAMHGAQRGAALTQRLLAFARRQDLKTEPTDLSQLVRDMRNLIERSIGNQIELIMQTRHDLPRVMVDANQVEMAVLNLAVNARDAMPNGGVLTITIDDATTDQPPGLQTGSYVRLLVADTGIGMDSKTLNKATEPFFSTKELGKGTGLGLSMIDGLARQLGGALRLRSIVGQGTTAEFWLPATTIQPATDVTARQVKIEPNTRKLTVLIVDDDALILMSTAMMVEDLGHDVIDVNSGLDALNVLRSGRAIDLLITDFSMPRMNGAELATAAREIIPDLPILLATGYAELPSGADPTLVRIGKPYQQAQLSDAVAKAMRSTRSV